MINAFLFSFFSWALSYLCALLIWSLFIKVSEILSCWGRNCICGVRGRRENRFKKFKVPYQKSKLFQNLQVCNYTKQHLYKKCTQNIILCKGCYICKNGINISIQSLYNNDRMAFWTSTDWLYIGVSVSLLLLIFTFVSRWFNISLIT